MNFWLLCCVLLFITSQGYGWLSQQAWWVMPELALPWILLGGTGLAIASNRHAFQKSVSSTQSKAECPPPPVSPLRHATPHESAAAIAPPPPAPLPPAAKTKSISFEISTRPSRTRH